MKWCTVLAVRATGEADKATGAPILDVTGVAGMSLVADDHAFGPHPDGLHMEGRIMIKDGELHSAPEPGPAEPQGGVPGAQAGAVPPLPPADGAGDPGAPGPDAGQAAAPGEV